MCVGRSSTLECVEVFEQCIWYNQEISTCGIVSFTETNGARMPLLFQAEAFLNNT